MYQLYKIEKRKTITTATTTNQQPKRIFKIDERK